MVRTGITQNSPEWYFIRQYMITASNVGQLVTSQLSRESKCKQLALSTPMLTYPEETGTFATDYGKMFEPVVKRLYHQHVAPLTDPEGGFWMDDCHPWLAASPDALDVHGVVEIKCPYTKVIPSPTTVRFKHYALQVFTQMHVTGEKHGRLVFWIPRTIDGSPRTELERALNRRITHELTIYEFMYDPSFADAIIAPLATLFETRVPVTPGEFEGWRPTLCTTIELMEAGPEDGEVVSDPPSRPAPARVFAQGRTSV